MLPLLLLLQTAPLPPPLPREPDAFCARTTITLSPIAADDAFMVLGKMPRSGDLYAGTLSVHRQGDRYVLARTVGGSTVRGEAFPVLCGPDKVRLLQVHYATAPVPTRFFCTVTTNYDNDVLANCGPGSKLGQADTGLEAWFPAPDSTR